MVLSLSQYTSAPKPSALQATEIASVRAILKHSSEVYSPFRSLATKALPPVPGIASDHAPSTLINRSMSRNAETSLLAPCSNRLSVITYFQPIPQGPNCSVSALMRHMGLISVLPFKRPA